jgi:thiol-disulfide isomerase/thioredoxin
MQSGKRTEADLAPQLKQLDALLAAHASEKTNKAGEMLLMKAGLYYDGFDKHDEGLAFYRQVVKEYPDTEAAQNAAQSITDNEGDLAAEKIRASLKPGVAFPNFSETDFAGQPLSLAGLKGKVVLVDFWATWCRPCVADLPNVAAAYEKYHDKGLEVVGISLDESKEALTKFLAAKKCAWPQFFDGKGWDNKLGQQYGIRSIPATYLLDKDGKIIAKDLHGEELTQAIAKAIGG